MALNGPERRSMLVTLVAKTMEEVVAHVNLPHHIPFTAHGNFFAESRD